LKKVLIVAAHADDEVLGCGGTIARHIDEGDEISVIVLCDDRHSMAAVIAQKFNYRLGVIGLPDQKFDTIPLLHITRDIENLIKTVHPQIVYTHHLGDLNLDHHITARAVLTACRPLPQSTVEEIYGFEVLSSTEWGLQPFQLAHFVEIDWARKLEALQCYDSEMRNHPHARSYDSAMSLAELRGGQCGVPFAEAFTVYRTIRRK
jgi:LmbE family N-acetylglucosaminyl deacetylase